MPSKSIAFHDYCSGMTYPVGKSRTPSGRFVLSRHCSSRAARAHGNRYQMRSQLVNRYCFMAAAMSLLVMPLRIQSQDSQSSRNKTVWDGVFSEDQASRGRASYNASCASCHGADLTSYKGALKGQKFMDHWR